MKKILLRPDEAAAVLAVSKSTVRRMIKEGSLKVLQLHDKGHLKITAESVLAHCKARQEKYDLENGLSIEEGKKRCHSVS